MKKGLNKKLKRVFCGLLLGSSFYITHIFCPRCGNCLDSCIDINEIPDFIKPEYSAGPIDIHYPVGINTSATAVTGFGI